MMRTVIFGFFCLGVGFQASAQNTALDLPDAVVNYRHDSIVLESISEGVWYKEYEVVFNEIPEEGNVYVESYPWFQSLESVDIQFLDPAGKVIRTIRRKDIKSGNSLPQYALFEDDRLYTFSDPLLQAPLRMRVSAKIRLEGLGILPRWNPYVRADWPVKRARFEVKYPVSETLHSKYSPDFKITEDRSQGRLSCSISDLPILDREAIGADLGERRSAVIIALERFSMAGIECKAHTWQELGRWQYQLMQGLDLLPPQLRGLAQETASAHSDPLARARALYAGMQQSKRYVSIQKGIGGYKPFSVEEVESNGYGDCKALSLYMVALLKEAGVKAYTALILSGDSKFTVQQDFPSFNFNHMIVCIPGKDTTWLECTSNTHPFGYMGSFTEGRPALLITETGGIMVNTPSASPMRNTKSRLAQLVVGADNRLSGQEAVLCQGSRIELPIELESALESDKQNWLSEVYGKRGFKASGFHLDMSDIPRFQARYASTLAALKPLQSAGTRLLMPVNPFSIIELPEGAKNPRSSPFLQTESTRDLDSLYFTLPAGKMIKALPADVTLQSPFGMLTQTMKMEEGRLLVVQEWIQLKGAWPAEQWKEYVAFLQSAGVAAKRMVIVE